jgi:acetyl-CoA carboxylase biotin carboxyl carrier protein
VAEILAEMVSTVFTVVAAPGQHLEAGETVVVLESMKMEIPVVTEAAGTVREIRVEQGQVVHDGDVLAVIDDD